MSASAQTTGGVFVTQNPLADPVSLFLVQAVLIIGLTRIIHIALYKLRQPRVIAEVIGGICLGPSVLGNIPGFTNTIFPASSLPFLTNVSNVGLVLYMFLVGLELDPATILRDLRRSVSISAAGIILPFAVGTAVSYGLYTRMLVPNPQNVTLSSFALFTGTAMSITAFPVLARILTEFKLLATPVGMVSITAAAMDDACAWTLDALVLSILNSGSSLNVLYIITCAFVYALLMLIPVRILFRKVYNRFFANKSETVNQLLVALIIGSTFVSAWMTTVIGIDGIFGAFLMGLIIPRGDNLGMKLTEKIEDLVNIVFLPLFFASSGLKTQLGLLNDGETWGWLLLVIFVACFGKVTGCAVAARLTGIKWREAISVGILMNTKGLVELIVLNIGYTAGVINAKIFAIMIVMALITTFMTSPIISFVYAPKYQTTALKPLQAAQQEPKSAEHTSVIDPMRLLIYVDAVESFPIVFGFIAMLRFPSSDEKQSLTIHALKIVETDAERSSAIMWASHSLMAWKQDTSLQIANFLGNSLNILTTPFIRTSPISRYGEEVNKVCSTESCNLVLIPWHYGNSVKPEIRRIILDSGVTTATYIPEQNADVDEPWFAQSGKKQNSHVLLLFGGGDDDREALKIALRLQQIGASLHVHKLVQPTTSQHEAAVEDVEALAKLKMVSDGGPLHVSAGGLDDIASADYALIIIGRRPYDKEEYKTTPGGGKQAAYAMQRSMSAHMTRMITVRPSDTIDLFWRYDELKLRERKTPVLVVSTPSAISQAEVVVQQPVGAATLPQVYS